MTAWRKTIAANEPCFQDRKRSLSFLKMRQARSAHPQFNWWPTSCGRYELLATCDAFLHCIGWADEDGPSRG